MKQKNHGKLNGVYHMLIGPTIFDLQQVKVTPALQSPNHGPWCPTPDPAPSPV